MVLARKNSNQQSKPTGEPVPEWSRSKKKHTMDHNSLFGNKKLKPATKKKDNCFMLMSISLTHPFWGCWISLKPCWSISCPTNPLHLGTMFHWSVWGHFQEWDFTLETSNFCSVPLREYLYQLNLPRDFLLENPNLRKSTKCEKMGLEYLYSCISKAIHFM